MGLRFRDSPESSEAEPKREVPVVGRRVDLEQSLERLRSPRMLAAVEIGSPECLENRALAVLEPVRSLENDRRLGVVAVPNQRAASLQQIVGRLLGADRLFVGDGGSLAVVARPDGMTQVARVALVFRRRIE